MTYGRVIGILEGNIRPFPPVTVAVVVAATKSFSTVGVAKYFPYLFRPVLGRCCENLVLFLDPSPSRLVVSVCLSQHSSQSQTSVATATGWVRK